MKKAIILLLYIFLGLPYSYAQMEDNNWIFNEQLGLNFNTENPTVIRSSIFGTGGTAAVSDPSGNLLFYTNGYWVWNRHHELMPELTGGVPGYTAPHVGTTVIGYPPLIYFPGWFPSQNAVITNVPNQANKYYLFSMGQSLACYSVIDMTLNDGMGGIDTNKKGILLISGVLSEKMIAVKGCNSIWLLTHALDQNRFYAYEINDTGIVNAPVISDAGTLPESWNLSGTMNAAPNGSMIALTSHHSSNINPETGKFYTKGAIELFDFDKNTGRVSNAQLLEFNDSAGTYYGSCFSPDNSKLYISKYPKGIFKGQVIQFDVSLSATTDIIDSRNIIYEYPNSGGAEYNIGGLKRAPNGKIYFNSRHNSGYSYPYIQSINNPNAYAADSDVDPSAVLIPDSIGGYTERGFATDLVLIDSIVWDTVVQKMQINTCFRSPNVVYAIDTMGRNYVWQDGTTGFQKTVHAAGWYSVQYIDASCNRAIDSIFVNIPLLPQFTNIGFSCTNGQSGQLWAKPQEGDTNNYTYRWMNNDMIILQEKNTYTGDTMQNLNPGYYYLTISTLYDCDTTIAMEVIAFPLPDASIIMDSIICYGTPITFTAQTDMGNNVLWLYGNQESSNDRSGTYYYPDITDYRIWLITTNPEGCMDTTYKDVAVKDFSFRLNATDTIIDRNASIDFYTHSLSPYQVMAWYPESLFPIQNNYNQTAILDTSYCISVIAQSEYGCIATDSLWVRVKPTIQVPTAFSPNGDGLNDYFRPIGMGAYTIQVFEIYNRWGAQVYYSFGPNALQGWDGRFKNEPAPQGVYYYRINIVSAERKTTVIKGDVTLVR